MKKMGSFVKFGPSNAELWRFKGAIIDGFCIFTLTSAFFWWIFTKF